MYKELPDDLKKQVAELLVSEDFVSAKKVYDQWMFYKKINEVSSGSVI